MFPKCSNCFEIVSRVVAKQTGLKYFNTGRPCIRGHLSGRFTSTGKCIDCGRSASKLWRQNNREKATEMENNWRILNPEKVKAQSQQWRIANPDYYSEYAAANRGQRVVNCLNYQLRKKQVGGKLSAGIWYKLFTAQNGLCPYCKADLRITPSAIDHKHPISLGGLNVDENVQLLCRSCNCSKSNTPLQQYELKIGYFRDANGVLDVAAVQQLF